MKDIFIKYIAYDNPPDKAEILEATPYKDKKGLKILIKRCYDYNEEVISMEDKTNGNCNYSFILSLGRKVKLDAGELDDIRLLLKIQDLIDTSQDFVLYEYKELKEV